MRAYLDSLLICSHFRKSNPPQLILIRTSSLSSSSRGRPARPESFHYLRVRGDGGVCFREWPACSLEGNQCTGTCGSVALTPHTSSPNPASRARLEGCPASPGQIVRSETNCAQRRHHSRQLSALNENRGRRVRAASRHANDGVGVSEGTGPGHTEGSGQGRGGIGAAL